MRKFVYFTIVTALLTAVILPAAVSAHDTKVQGSAQGLHIGKHLHKKSVKGTVTAVNGNSFTLEIKKHKKIIGPLTVNTSTSTIIKKDGATTTMSDIHVGSKLKIKGIWDKTLNVFNAIRIRIKK